MMQDCDIIFIVAISIVASLQHIVCKCVMINTNATPIATENFPP